MIQCAIQFPPASGNTDPVTSYRAEKRITDSGKRETQAMLVLRVLGLYPNRTAGELSRDTGLDYHMICRRLADLQHNRTAIAGGARECGTGRGQCQVWNPA